MTLDELKTKVPASYQPWVESYGPAFLAMTATEIKAWIELLIRGDALEAYKQVLSKMTNTDLLAEWDKRNAAWQTANDANAARLEMQRAAAVAACKILLGIALAVVGL